MTREEASAPEKRELVSMMLTFDRLDTVDLFEIMRNLVTVMRDVLPDDIEQISLSVSVIALDDE